MSAEEDPRLRRSGLLAGLAFFLLVTSVFLAWWVVTGRTADSNGSLASVYPLLPDENVHHWAQVLTVVLLGVLVAWLFVRLASRARVHEPGAWHRDLGAHVSLGVATLASGMLWPVELPFWGGRTYLLDNATGEQVTVVANPGLGWWVAVVAILLLGWAWWLSRPRADPVG